MAEIVILSALRTPMGAMMGAFADRSASDLGAAAIRTAVADAGVPLPSIDTVVMGNVIGAGQGQAPARQAALKAGLPDSAPATTLNKMCGSGMQAVMDAFDRLRAGSATVAIAGGMESMSRAPYLIQKARGGFRLGHGEVKDSMFLDGLEDAYEPGRLMGSFADATARTLQFSREAQDDFAIASLDRACRAQADGAFKAEIVPIGDIIADEPPSKAKRDRIRTLRPAFTPDGTITAANASSIADGAAALVLARAGEGRGVPIARIVGHAVHARAPADFAIAPGPAIHALLDRIEWTVDDVDLFEINEAFAVVTMAVMRDFRLPHDRVNVNGGACALGHPIGASGARIMVTLIHALRRRGLRRGIASLCIGGGEATALALEIV